MKDLSERVEQAIYLSHSALRPFFETNENQYGMNVRQHCAAHWEGGWKRGGGGGGESYKLTEKWAEGGDQICHRAERWSGVTGVAAAEEERESEGGMAVSVQCSAVAADSA